MEIPFPAAAEKRRLHHSQLTIRRVVCATPFAEQNAARQSSHCEVYTILPSPCSVSQFKQLCASLPNLDFASQRDPVPAIR